MLKPHFRKKSEAEETGIVEVGDVKIDAGSAEIVFVDPDKDIQVVVSDDPENKDGAVVAVLTASAEDVEDEKVLGSANVEPEGEDKGAGDDEARKAEARKRFRERFEARQKAKKEEARKKAVEEARAKFRAHAKKA